MSTSALDRPFSCSQCTATYVRLAHLRRHERTHNEGRQFTCPFCHSAFARSDAARRHSKTCNEKKDQPIPTPLKRGRKTKACDACAVSKRACDGGRPCSSCQARKHPCLRSRIPQNNNQLARQIQGQLAPSHPLQASLKAADFGDLMTPHHKPLRLTFLLHYTDPHNNSLQEYFASASQKASKLLSFDNSANSFLDIDMGGILENWNWDIFPQYQPLQFGQDALETPFLGADSTLHANAAYTSHDLIIRNPYYHAESSNMESRLETIVSALKANTRIENLDGDSSELLKSANFVFCLSKIDTFIQSYFAHWYRHCPILHPSSFNPSTAYTPLLAAVILVGALFLSPESAKAARDCLDSAENYIFEHPEFQQLFRKRAPDGPFPDLAPLQAAFTISIPQHWDNHRESRKRVRLHRYSDLVSAARQLGLTKLRHSTTSPESIDSNLTTRIEEGIRLTIWIFLVDSSHAIFHRSPPRLTLNEMTGALPCEEELFLRHDFGTHQEELARQSLAKVPSLAQGMALLMGEKWIDTSPAQFGHLSHLDLFVLISGLHEIIFSASGACSFTWAKPTLREALARWKIIWDINIKRYSHIQESSLGFFQYADEFWWLAKLFLEDSAPITKSREGDLDQDSMGLVNDFIKRFADINL